MKNNGISRRTFLSQGGSCLAAGSLLGSIGQLGSLNAYAQDAGDYRALVCILLAGGADSFNMLVPAGSAEYSEYASVRADIALPQSTLLPLDGSTQNGKKLGLHPGLTELQGLYSSGDIAWLANTGPLVEPTTPQALAQGSARLPLGLYSHVDQIAHWQTGTPDRRIGSGWGGRMADLMQSTNTNPNISMSFSLSGRNLYQAGVQTQQYSINADEGGAPQLMGTGQDEPIPARIKAIESMYNANYRNPMRRTYLKVFNGALAANAEFSAAMTGVAGGSTVFPSDELGAAMNMITRTIAARDTLGMQRQSFLVVYGGWDHHDEVINAQSAMLPSLSQNLAAFNSAMKEQGLADQVTTFTTSDFGRTLTSNGRGSDHGWGGNHLIMGGAVNGGAVYGEYPDLALNNPLDTGRGVLMPTTASDLYFAELAQWFGISSSDLELVLPNLGRFYSVSSGQPPVGFIA